MKNLFKYAVITCSMAITGLQAAQPQASSPSKPFTVTIKQTGEASWKTFNKVPVEVNIVNNTGLTLRIAHPYFDNVSFWSIDGMKHYAKLGLKAAGIVCLLAAIGGVLYYGRDYTSKQEEVKFQPQKTESIKPDPIEPIKTDCQKLLESWKNCYQPDKIRPDGKLDIKVCKGDFICKDGFGVDVTTSNSYGVSPEFKMKYPDRFSSEFKCVEQNGGIYHCGNEGPASCTYTLPPIIKPTVNTVHTEPGAQPSNEYDKLGQHFEAAMRGYVKTGFFSIPLLLLSACLRPSEKIIHSYQDITIIGYMNAEDLAIEPIVSVTK